MTLDEASRRARLREASLELDDQHRHHRLRRILRLAQVMDLVSMSSSSIYELINEGAFPAPIPLSGKRTVGWLEDELVEWQRQRVAMRDLKAKAAVATQEVTTA